MNEANKANWMELNIKNGETHFGIKDIADGWHIHLSTLSNDELPVPQSSASIQVDSRVITQLCLWMF